MFWQVVDDEVAGVPEFPVEGVAGVAVVVDGVPEFPVEGVAGLALVVDGVPEFCVFLT